MKSYEACLAGEFEHVERLERVYESLRRRPRQEVKVQVEDEESESGEEMTEEDTREGGADGKDGQGMEVDDGPVVDEDGFQLVQGKGRRRGR